jgi:outer membrane cobalamin receptor
LTIWGTILNANLSNSWKATMGVKNLFDKNYESAYGYPAQGRNIYGLLSWSF